ncbi:MAG: LacI family transcriptional regulator [Nocardioides sp.]|nr:LacI family transcriptional regulator [Nocardioides sp.]
MQAVDALCSAIGGQPLPSHDYLFKPDLVLRASTGHAPTRAES